MDNTTVPATTTEGTEPTEKKMYRVEKFLPTNCPRCNKQFQNESRDWGRLLGDIVNGEKVIRETSGYVIIICNECRNYTAQVPLEAYQLGSKEKAKQLCEEEGFVNFQTVTAYGNHCQDMHSKSDAPDGTKLIPECPKCRRKDLTLLGDGRMGCECGNVTMAAIGGGGPWVYGIKCE
jgi:hypothetical protein